MESSGVFSDLIYLDGGVGGIFSIGLSRGAGAEPLGAPYGMSAKRQFSELEGEGWGEGGAEGGGHTRATPPSSRVHAHVHGRGVRLRDYQLR